MTAIRGQSVQSVKQKQDIDVESQVDQEDQFTEFPFHEISGSGSSKEGIFFFIGENDVEYVINKEIDPNATEIIKGQMKIPNNLSINPDINALKAGNLFLLAMYYQFHWYSKDSEQIISSLFESMDELGLTNYIKDNKSFIWRQWRDGVSNRFYCCAMTGSIDPHHENLVFKRLEEILVNNLGEMNLLTPSGCSS